MDKNNYFSSERLLYRPYMIEDLHTLVAFRNEESRRRWFYFQEPEVLTEETAAKDIKRNIELWSRKVDILKEEAGLAITLKRTNEMIGFVGLGKARCEHVEIGYEIGEQFQRNGYATEAVKAAVEWGFDKLKEVGAELKIVCKIEPENLASRKVAEKSGFTHVYDEPYLYVYEITANIY